MTGRAKWDPMRDDFNNSIYDDEELNEKGKLDHCRLYITNIPKGLNDDGLRAAFERFGTLQETFLSRDPQKKYAIVKYETSSEAKLAMMKMNRTEPLKLWISIAYKNKKSDRRENHQNDANYNENNRDDIASVSSRGRSIRKDDNTNGSNIAEDNLQFEDMILTDDGMDTMGLMDSSLDLKLESLKLEQLKLREEQLLCRHRMLMIQQNELAEKRQFQMPQPTSSNSRCILPNGRIVVRNVSDRLLEPRDSDVTHVATGSDSLKIPGLQRVASRACVLCGEPADAFCSRCAVTPYCSQRCQRRDWNERHKGVCHNLARLVGSGDIIKDEEEIPIPSSSVNTRQPHSPAVQSKREVAKRDDPDKDKANKNFIPAEHKAPFTSSPGYRPNARDSKTNKTSTRIQETRRPPSCKQVPKDQPEEDWGNTSKISSKQQQQLEEPPSHKIKDKRKATPQAVSSTSSPSVKTDATVWQSPVRTEQQRQPVRQNAARTLQKESRPDAVQAPAKEAVKVTSPTSNGAVGTAPAHVLIPRTCLIEELNVGEVLILSVDSESAECRSKQPGHVCLSMHERFENDFERLCGDYAVDCDAEEDYRPKPGDMFSFLNNVDGGWYRARSLAANLAALIDSCKVVAVTPNDKCKRLPTKYADIPEFCCLLDAKDVKVGANLKCTLVSKTTNGFKVTLQDVEAGVEVGDGVVTRWLPEIDYPVPTGTGIPEVCRPCVLHNSRVLLVDATAPDRLVVRPADADSQKAFDAILQDVLFYGIEASPMTEPPSKGQTVVGKYTDGLHYRALCKRTNIKQNKYLLEYIEYGNIEVSKLEMLYPCPEKLDTVRVPTLASVVTLGLEVTNLTPNAEQYLEALKDEEMILTIPNGAKSAPSGSVVTLTLVKNNEVLNRKVEELCTPEWKKIEERGGDVIEIENLMYDQLDCSVLPSAGCTLEILDDSLLPQGSVSGCEAGLLHTHYVFNKLAERMGEYCNSELGRESYLPKLEELCIAQYPPTGQWYRAVLLEQVNGPGGDKVRVLYVDYGYLLVVPVALLRKMLPEFVRDLPAVASHLDIRDFPENPTGEMLERARRYMKMTPAGRGELKVSRCERQEENGLYTIDAPDLISAIYSS